MKTNPRELNHKIQIRRKKLNKKETETPLNLPAAHLDLYRTGAGSPREPTTISTSATVLCNVSLPSVSSTSL